MKEATITAKFENLNPGAAELVVEVLEGLVKAVHAGTVAVQYGDHTHTFDKRTL